MSKLYICNTTRQKQHLSFRVPEMKHAYFVPIKPGTQVLVDPNIGPSGQAEIVKQIEFYGGRDAATVSGKLENFPGIFYRFDRPIPVDDIQVGHEAVLDAADQRAAGARNASAMAFDLSQRDETGQRLASETEVEVVEQIPAGQKPTGKEVKSKITVTPEGNDRLKI